MRRARLPLVRALLCATLALAPLAHAEQLTAEKKAAIQELMEVDACALILPDEAPGYLTFRAASGWHLRS